MKLFNCSLCNHIVFFENTACESCGASLGFIPDELKMHAFASEQEQSFTSEQADSKISWRYCANHQHNACNWLINDDSSTGLCLACELNRYIPNLGNEDDHEGWRELEFAKHRLVYSLLRLGLPIHSKQTRPKKGIAFDFIDTEKAIPAGAAQMTGHSQGQITVTLDEADPAKREEYLGAMNERYRRLLGHLRHEIGHYYWDLLIAPDQQQLQSFRTLFGDEQLNYSEALNNHYNQGSPPNWRQHYISAYATSHPWEDWAETWAHYLHIMDMLETAYSVGLSTAPPTPAHQPFLTCQISTDPYLETDINALLQTTATLSIALNSLNRSMGLQDLYPFILTDTVKEKIGYIHRLLHPAS
ncbi:zinc-binding metallopeptidase family protein [Pseudomaricurvus sp.]|uniref:zinc-binding metallopeptidase family protein n=1 Tax=Pseudomaricurvus sp. TaxID=2004510 RepID=UPI003F6D18F1